MISWEKYRFISTFYNQCSKPVCKEYGLTMMQYNILMFITENPQCDTAAQIVRLRALTKSHVSTALRDLELRGFITREFRDGNSKTAHISVSDICYPIIEKGRAAQEEFMTKIFENFSPEELSASTVFYAKMCENAEKYLR